MAIRSPFPGMDPWLEQHWGDIHASLITYARDALNRHLPPGLRARMEERVYLESHEERVRHAVPDVRVVEFSRSHLAGKAVRGAAPGIAVAEPLVVEIQNDPITETFVQIIDARSGNRVVTVIEILSPSNKRPGTGQDLYLAKQEEVVASGASLVEVDLLRDGRRVLACSPVHVPPSHRTPYQVCVKRGWRKFEYEVYRVPLREPLPGIRIPLRQGDEDAVLALQDLLEQAYANGGYDTIDYAVDPIPPLPADDKAWATEILRSRS
ncbi:MAG: DUF4058 family protein [Phycisphaerae bacterium]